MENSKNRAWTGCSCNSLNGVCCDVAACKYHATDCSCHADQIRVESRSAMKKGETFCSTFEAKAE